MTIQPPESELVRTLREARAAREASKLLQPVEDAYLLVLKEAEDAVLATGAEAYWKERVNGRRTLMVAPTNQPGRATSLLDIEFKGGEVTVLWGAPGTLVSSPEDLKRTLMGILKQSRFLDSIDELLEQADESVEGFLRVRPSTTSRDDVMFEVPREDQERIAKAAKGDDKRVSCELKISSFAGAGKVVEGAPYVVLESAGYSVTLTTPVELLDGQAGVYRIVGSAALTAVD